MVFCAGGALVGGTLVSLGRRCAFIVVNLLGVPFLPNIMATCLGIDVWYIVSLKEEASPFDDDSWQADELSASHHGGDDIMRM